MLQCVAYVAVCRSVLSAWFLPVRLKNITDFDHKFCSQICNTEMRVAVRCCSACFKMGRVLQCVYTGIRIALRAAMSASE